MALNPCLGPACLVRCSWAWVGNATQLWQRRNPALSRAPETVAAAYDPLAERTNCRTPLGD